MIKVSIIIPIYNVQPYIEACLQSVANQTMTEGVECILVDDCGTDKSVHIAEEFINSYQGDILFRMIHHEQNGGLSAARNSGIYAARGEFVYFLDSDDKITTDCLSSFFRIVEKYNSVELIQGHYYEVRYIKNYDKISFPEYTEDRKLIKSSLLDSDIIPVAAQNRLVRREVIINNNLFFPEGIIHEDNYWTFFLAKHIRKMSYCRTPTYEYTYNPNSITGNPNMEKKCKAYRYIISSFCHNIDEEEKAAQKKAILYLFLNMRAGMFYKTEKEYNCLTSLVMKQYNCFEKPLFYLCTCLPQKSFVYNKIVRLLIRCFRWFN